MHPHHSYRADRRRSRATRARLRDRPQNRGLKYCSRTANPTTSRASAGRTDIPTRAVTQHTHRLRVAGHRPARPPPDPTGLPPRRRARRLRGRCAFVRRVLAPHAGAAGARTPRWLARPLRIGDACESGATPHDIAYHRGQPDETGHHVQGSSHPAGHRSRGRHARGTSEPAGVIPDRRPLVVCANPHPIASGAINLIEAWQQVLAARPEALLLIVGAGADRGLLQRRAGELGIYHGVGFVDGDPSSAPYIRPPTSSWFRHARRAHPSLGAARDGSGALWSRPPSAGCPKSYGTATRLARAS